MLKRSKFLVLFLVVTVLCASIGFANLTTTLSVDGNVGLSALTADTLNEYITFTGTPTITASSNVTEGLVATIAKTGSEPAKTTDDLTITVPAAALTAKGQTITVKATISSTYIGTVNLTAGDFTFGGQLGSYLTGAVSFNQNTITSSGTAATSEVTITLTVKELPLTAIESQTVACTITATAQ